MFRLSRQGATCPALIQLGDELTHACMPAPASSPSLPPQLDRMHAIPVGLKPVWDRDFLSLLYDTITQKTVRVWDRQRGTGGGEACLAPLYDTVTQKTVRV